MLSDIYKKKQLLLKSGSAEIIIDDFNKRIKILQFDCDIEELIDNIDQVIQKNKIGKLFCVATKDKIESLKKQNFITEAKINGLFNGKDGYFLSRFCISQRKINTQIPEEEEVLIKAREYLIDTFSYDIGNKYIIRNAVKQDSKEMAVLYDSVFKTYPSPLNDPDFIEYAMDNDVMFKVLLHEGKIVSAASADKNAKYLNAEITDCATYNSYRGEGLMGRLIYELEIELRKENYTVLYSTARALSAGMNIVFAKHGYEYGGRLINHCHICGQFENMNIWLKTL